jgi:phosphatidylglycerophosphate synthase
MIDTKYRKKIQPAFDWLGVKLKKIGFKPYQITILALVIGLFSALMIAMNNYIIGIFFLWLSGLFDVLDGTLARLLNQSSKKGAYMDLIFDRFVEAAVIMGFYYSAPEHVLAYLLFFIGAIYNFSTFMAAGALFKNTGIKGMHYDVGLVERTETFVFFTLMLIFNHYIFELLMFFNVIMFLTGSIRFYKVMNYTHDPRG